jgi:hypothetical protein
MSEYYLNGKVAVITGANKGLGKAMAFALGAAGASIALASRDVEQLIGVKEAVENVGGKAQVFQVDVSEEEQIRMQVSSQGRIFSSMVAGRRSSPFQSAWREELRTSGGDHYASMCKTLVPCIQPGIERRQIFLWQVKATILVGSERFIERMLGVFEW